MPQVQVINTTRDKPEPTDVSKMFSKLSQSYKEVQDQEEFGKLISSYQQNQNEANALENLWADLAKSTLGPTKRLEAMNTIKGMSEIVQNKEKILNEKFKAEQLKKEKLEAKEAKKLEAKDKQEKTENENYEILIANGVPEEDAQRLKKVLSPASAKSYGKPKSQGKGPKETFETAVASKYGQLVPEMEASIAEGTDTLSNIDEVLNISEKELTGIGGYVKGFLNLEDAAKVKTLSAASLKSVIKLFNPVGALPVQKLEWIRNTFAVNPTDTLSTIRGKVHSMKLIAQQAKDRAEKRLDLIKQYSGNIPTEVMKKFNDETLGILDNLEKGISPKEKGKEKGKPREDGKIKVRSKDSKKTGWVTPFEGMEDKYELL